eukprot:scaffold16915_cov42-Attheya_sp.AAC.2
MTEPINTIIVGSGWRVFKIPSILGHRRSQVCSSLWPKHQNEICSSHGGSENQLSLWQFPTMSKIQDFKGHQARVLNMEQSPESGCVLMVAASADETFTFLGYVWFVGS